MDDDADIPAIATAITPSGGMYLLASDGRPYHDEARTWIEHEVPFDAIQVFGPSLVADDTGRLHAAMRTTESIVYGVCAVE